MIRFIALFCLAFGSLATPLSAQSTGQGVLVELFASKNCSACPRAHRLLKEVSAKSDIFVLTWSVDYWDYLEQPDPLAIPESSARQASYVEWMSLRAPYTPQSVYNGVREGPGHKRGFVNSTIESLTELATRQSVTIEIEDGRYAVRGKTDTPLSILKVEYLMDGQHGTDISNPVIAAKAIQTFRVGQASVSGPLICEGACAVLVQEIDMGEVVAFARLEP